MKSESKTFLTPIIGLQPVAEAGFPDVTCPVIFLPGCNFRCPYCMNSKAVTWGGITKYTPDDVIKYLKDNGEDQLLISGGEPCLHFTLPDLINTFKEEGIRVRLSTNGSRPAVLADLIESRSIEFVAMDIKMPLYPQHSDFLVQTVNSDLRNVEKVRESVDLLNNFLGAGRQGFSVEFRTTLYPNAVNENDIKAIGKAIHPKAQWVLQQFRKAKSMLDPAAYDVQPYSDEEVQSLLETAKQVHEKTDVRWP